MPAPNAISPSLDATYLHQHDFDLSPANYPSQLHPLYLGQLHMDIHELQADNDHVDPHRASIHLRDPSSEYFRLYNNALWGGHNLPRQNHHGLWDLDIDGLSECFDNLYDLVRERHNY
jgi:hypothetical protein